MSDKIQAGGYTVSLETPDDALLVEAYGDGGFRLMGRRVEGSVFIRQDGFYPFPAADLAALTPDAIAEAMQDTGPIEILLVGTGTTMALLPKSIREYPDEQGIGFDVMSTGAAARTYNVLMIEDRRVAAILLQVP